MLAELTAEIEDLDGDDLRDYIRSVDTHIRQCEAKLAVAVAKSERTNIHHRDGHASLRGYLRAELRWSDAEITHRQRLARLVDTLPDVVEALAAGQIGVAQARLFGKAHANPRCGHQLGEHTDILLGHARTLSHDDFAICIRRWELLADADGAHTNAQANHEHRHISMLEFDGGGHIVARCGAVDFAEIKTIWERYCDAQFTADWNTTRTIHGDNATIALMPRNAAQRGFDAFKQLCIDAASTPPGAQPPQPTLNIVIDHDTFERTLAELELIPHTNLRPTLPVDRWRSETLDGTLITPTEAVLAGIHGHIRRVVFDTTGTVTNIGHRKRLFQGTLRQAVLLQALRCIWPGCTIPAGRCQADHTQPWQHGGPTTTTNGAPLCARHNRHKNRGYTTWRDPTGTWHTYRPDGTEIGNAA